jgi:glycogenin glucosyltransferase
MFWGEERDQEGELPAAEGVPDQSEWVCPQCGFSSPHASAFSRRRGSFASVSKHVQPHSSTVASIIDAPGSDEPERKDIVDLRDETPLAEEQEAEQEALEEAKEVAVVSVETVTNARSGLSATGVPLASLTDPRLFLK